MSTYSEKLAAISHAVDIAKRRLRELDSKPSLSRAELFERDMTVNCIERGEILLGKRGLKMRDAKP